MQQQSVVRTRSSRFAIFFRAQWLLFAILLWPTLASAQVSPYCPTQSMTVANGGSVTSINLAACDGPFNFGMGGPFAPFLPANGSVVLSSQSGPGNQTVTYTHNGTATTTDTFALEDENGDELTFNVTITPPTSAIIVSPASLPTLTAGTSFSQTLTSTGGAAPYTYTLSGGTLPTGLTLSAAGVLSGTPTQRGGYAFGVRSQDNVGAFVIKGYTGTVQNPSLSLATPSATAVQGAPFSLSLAVNGGVAPHSFQHEVVAGPLPPGISLSAAGVLSGTPTTLGTTNFQMRVTDASTGLGSYFELENYSFTVVAPPSVSIADVTVNEGNAGTTNFTFTVSLSAPAGPGGVTFDIATANGTASAGVDYVANSLTGQTIPAGNSTYSFTVLVNGDTLSEPNKTFFVNVTNVTNAVVGDAQGVGTITNDDPAPSLSINDVTVTEGNAGTVNAVFTVTLSAASGQTVTVNYATADGTATQPADYTNTSGTLTFTPGATTQTITVPVIGETVPEANETFFVNLSGAVNATIADNQGVGTITNDDVPVTVNPATIPNATVATAYSQTLTASGGTAPYGFAVTAGALPAGLTLSSGGILSGTSTAGGTFNFTVTATDSSGLPGPFSGSRAYTLVVNPATVVLPATPLAGGTLGAAYSAAITPASGGTAPYTYAVTAGALPGGLTLNAATGAITGTPSALGTFNFAITATDSSTGSGPYSSAPRGYSIVVLDNPPVTNSGTLTVAYNAAATPVPLNITGGTPTSVAIASTPTTGTAIATGTTITYQPAAGFAGSDSFTYTASNSGGTSVPATVTVTVSEPVITITAGGSLAATVAVAYTQTFTWSGGAQPWSSYQVTNLPAGVSITGTTANTVTISGTPTQAGSFNLNVSATDSSTGNGPYSVGEAFTLTVAGPTLALAPAGTTFTAPYNVAYSQSFTASGGVGPYTYARTGTLPPDLSFAGNTVSGTPATPGSYSFTITATDTGATGTGAPFTVAQNYTITVAAPTIAVNPATLPNPTAGAAYSQTLTATGGAAPYTFALTAGALPNGIALASGGALSGTSTASGTFAFTIAATDANGQMGDRAYTLVVAVPTLAVTPVTLPAGTAGTAYSQTLTISGGIAPYTAALSGVLPAGLTFNAATRSFSGTPTQSGTFNISVTVTDSTGGTAATITTPYTLSIAAPSLTLTPATVPSGTGGVAYAQMFSASGGIAPYSYTVSAGALPQGLTLNASTGALAGTPSVAGSFNFSITGKDSTTGAAGSVTQAYTLPVSAPAITLTPETLPAGLFAVSYPLQLTAVGGTAPYRYAVTSGALPAGLTLSNQGLFTGAPNAAGTFTVTITVTDALNFTGLRVYTLTVAPRPDPALDPEVRGLLNAQSEAAHRFATSQIGNFQQRMQRLHGRGAGTGFSNMLSASARSPCNREIGSLFGNHCDANRQQPFDGDATSQSNAATADRVAADASASPLGIWTAGTLRSGGFDNRVGTVDLDFETDGVSFGADYRVSDHVVVGLGAGYGRDRTHVGNNGSRSDATAYSLAAYTSISPTDRFFIDALFGYQTLDFDLRRHVTADGSQVMGSRKGSQWFGSVSTGADLALKAWQFTPYLRVDAAHGELDGYREQSNSPYALQYGAMDVESLTGNVGVRFDYRQRTTWGSFSPQLNTEYQHDFSGNGLATMQYNDLLRLPFYRSELDGYSRSRWLLGAGMQFNWDSGWGLRVDYRTLVGGSSTDHGLQLYLDAKF